jgi:hypothetical protein
MKSKSKGQKLVNLATKVASNPETKDQEPISSSRRYPSRSREPSPIVPPNPKRNKTASDYVGEMASVEPSTAEATPDTVNSDKTAVEPMVEETKDKDGATSAQQKPRDDDSYDPSEEEDDEDEDDEDEDEGVATVLPPPEKVGVPKNKRGRQIKKIVTPQGQFPNSLGSDLPLKN